MTKTKGMSTPTSSLEKEDNFSNNIQLAIFAVGVLFFFVLLYIFVTNESSSPLALRPNIYSLLPAISIVTNLIAFFLIAKSKRRSQALIWFSVFLMSLAIWSGIEMLIRSSVTSEAALFWSSLSTIGSVIMPTSFFLFAINFTNAKRSLNPYLLPILLSVSVLFIMLDRSTNLLSNYDLSTVTWAPWGYIQASGTYYYLIVIWVLLLPAAAIYTLISFLKNDSLDPVLRKQTKFIIAGSSIALIGGAITDGVLPALNIVVIPPLVTFLFSIMGILISYSLYKYRSFIFTPDLIASEILSTMNEAVIGTNVNFDINYANSGAERLLGYSPQVLVTKNIEEFIEDKWTPEQLRHNLVSGLNKENRKIIDSLNLICAESKRVITKLSLTRIKAEGQPTGYLIVLTDITALAQTKKYIEQQVIERTRQLAEEQTRFLASIKSLTVGFMFTDSTGKVLMSNPAMSTIMGDEDKDKERGHKRYKLLQAALTTQTADTTKLKSFVSKEVETEDGKVYHIVTTPVMSKTDESDGTVVLVNDITEAKIQERSKDEFFSIASHELRTPLTSIKGNTSMILDYYKKQLEDPSLREMVEDVHTSSIRLIGIVNDFLDVSRLEQGKVSFECDAIDLREVLDKVGYEIKTLLDDKKITLKVDERSLSSAPKIWADKNRLQQVIYNLIGNAAKFTENGTITLKVSVDHAQKMLRVHVIDTGRGMTAESQQLLFRKFQQASSSLLTRDTTKGTGLGLYISKMIIEGMGGAIALDESIEGKGSTFSFTIPLAESNDIKKSVKTLTDSKTGITELVTPQA